MSASIGQSIDAVCKEKGIDREVVIETVENPGRELSLEEARELAGDEVEVGDELQLPLPVEDLGRIAAQTAKQILFQKVRDAERANIYEQYIDKVGDLVNGYVKRFERGDIIDDLSKESKGPQVIVSRTSPEILKRLFEMEVPEIYDGTVVIKSAVREPGERAKIAVASTERDVDPVGACVGMKGSRVQAIIRELRGEKIDIIEWSEEPSVFAANALSPAKVNQVRITDIESRQMEVIVNEDQLSLAIGKRGQNVRLATKLVGWNIDIRSEDEIKREVAEQMGALIASGGAVPLTALEGVTAATSATLAEHGINDIDALASTDIDDLVEYLDTSLDEAESILAAAQSIVAARERSKQQEAEAGAAESAGEGEAAGEGVAAEAASAEAQTTGG